MKEKNKKRTFIDLTVGKLTTDVTKGFWRQLLESVGFLVLLNTFMARQIFNLNLTGGALYVASMDRKKYIYTTMRISLSVSSQSG